MHLIEKLFEKQRQRNKCKTLFHEITKRGTFSPKGEPINKGEPAPVFLNIYDMDMIRILTNKESPHILVFTFPKINKVLSPFGIGVFHVGVEVHGHEYSFRGSEIDSSGIYDVTPKRAGVVMQFRKSILVGETFLKAKDIKSILEQMGKTKYIGKQYHLLRKNCGSFCKELTQILCHKEMPKWINRLARVVRTTKFMEAIFPPEYFMP